MGYNEDLLQFLFFFFHFKVHASSSSVQTVKVASRIKTPFRNA